MDEKTLIQGCLKHKKEYQRALYDTYRKQMYSICLRYHKEQNLATESLQRGFIKIFDSLHTFNQKGKLQSWIKSIIIRTAIDVLKEQNKLAYEEFDNLEEPYEMPNNNLENHQVSFDEMINLLNKLPTGYRTVFTMFVLDGIKHKQISEVLGISVSTSKTQLFKARKMMKESLLKHFGHILLQD